LAVFKEKSRLKALLDHFSIIDDPREPRSVAHPLREVLLLVVCASMADCDYFDAIAAWGKENIAFLRRYLPYEHGAPGGRWLTLAHEPRRSGAVLARFHRLGPRWKCGWSKGGRVERPHPGFNWRQEETRERGEASRHREKAGVRSLFAHEAPTQGHEADAHQHQAPQKNRELERRLSRHRRASAR
jgi:hypothetical protein